MVYLSIMVTVLVLVNAIPFILSLLGPKPPKSVSFENDIVFLNYLIGVEIEDYKNYIVTPAKAAGKALMTDDDLKKYRENMILSVYSQISSNYFSILYKYFSEEGLRQYISNTINNEITKVIINYNKLFFNKDTKSDFTNVSAVDMN